MEVKAVLLDVDNTLLDFNLCAKAAMQAGMAAWGLAFDDSMFPVFQRINNQLWHEIEKGVITKQELYRVRWPMIFSALGVDADGEAFEQLFRQYVSESCVQVQGAMELLRYLSRKYPLYAASNASQNQQLKRLANAGMLGYIRQVFSSEHLGANKPARAFFDGCFRALAPLKPAECVMIGDSLYADVEGAKNYGLHAVWYNHDALPVPDECAADHVVHSLLDIQSIL